MKYKIHNPLIGGLQIVDEHGNFFCSFGDVISPEAFEKRKLVLATLNNIDFIPAAVPDKWNFIEAHPVKEEDGVCEQCDAKDAHFYSVYLHDINGGISCIADLPTEELAYKLQDLIDKAVENYKEI